MIFSYFLSRLKQYFCSNSFAACDWWCVTVCFQRALKSASMGRHEHFLYSVRMTSKDRPAAIPASPHSSPCSNQAALIERCGAGSVQLGAPVKNFLLRSHTYAWWKPFKKCEISSTHSHWTPPKPTLTLSQQTSQARKVWNGKRRRRTTASVFLSCSVKSGRDRQGPGLLNRIIVWLSGSQIKSKISKIKPSYQYVLIHDCCGDTVGLFKGIL